MKKGGGALAAGAGIGALILFIGGKAFATSTDETPPKKPRRVKGLRAIVAFTQVAAPIHVTRRGKTRVMKRIQIAESIEELVAAASEAMGRPVSVDAFLLATLVASEAESQPTMAKVAIAYAALTQAQHLNVPLRTLLAPKKLGGKLGGQLGGYASTARPPTKADIEIGEGVLGGKYQNPTPGAVQWDSPRAQDKLLEKRTPGYEINADQLARRRASEGKIAVYVDSVNHQELRLWKPVAA